MKILLFPCLLLLATIIHAQGIITSNYFFNGNFNENNGGPSLQEILACSATNGTFGKEVIVTSAGSCANGDSANTFMFNQGGGVQYSNSLNEISRSYTIQVFFKFNVLGGWSRIIDFSNSTADKGIYLLGNCLNFFPNGNVGPTCPFEAGKFYLMSFVRDSVTKIITVYVDGVLYSSYNDAADNYISTGSATPINFFRDDNAVPCEAKPGSIKYLSISNTPIDSIQVHSVWNNICVIALPVTWQKVTATLQGKNALINWSTATELNTSYFSIQHSTNGRDFTDVGRVTAKGSSAGKTDYSFTHTGLSNGTHYYRIKQVDKDNRLTYSAIVTITVNGNSVFAVFPNPAKGMVSVTGLSGNGTLQMLSMEGKKMLEQKVSTQSTTINITQFSPGIYILRYTDGLHSWLQKIIKN